MRFCSILFEKPQDRPAEQPIAAPDFFADLDCDHIVSSVTAGWDEYDLRPFFHGCPCNLETINYRQEVIRELENPALRQEVDAFASAMRAVRARLAQARQSHYREQQQAVFRDAVEIYCRTVGALATALSELELQSRGFLSFREYLTAYVGSARFARLATSASNLKSSLAEVEYCVHIRGNAFTVRRYNGEADYSAQVEATFAKFKHDAPRDYRSKVGAGEELNHIEAKILEFVAKLHPRLFAALETFCLQHAGFMDETLAVFDREVQFYAAYLSYIAPLKAAGLRFCYPNVSERANEIFSLDGFDLALARKRVDQGARPVCNDIRLTGDERVLVITGPNQGGKTTFARAFGQLHYLASIGCPVPGRAASLLLFDRMFTHFERQEKVENLRGKLEDDLKRVQLILAQATSRSVILLNEVFTSTTIRDETYLSTKLMEKIAALGALCVWVTFVDELASFGPQTVSMVSTVVPQNPALRTFKILRRPADGLAHALAIAQKHRLTYDLIRERIGS